MRGARAARSEPGSALSYQPSSCPPLQKMADCLLVQSQFTLLIFEIAPTYLNETPGNQRTPATACPRHDEPVQILQLCRQSMAECYGRGQQALASKRKPCPPRNVPSKHDAAGNASRVSVPTCNAGSGPRPVPVPFPTIWNGGHAVYWLPVRRAWTDSYLCERARRGHNRGVQPSE
jgi:hypothetical protein